MLISIIIPFKNATPWLEETISSILAQDGVDWELICVDDHSTDTGAEIIKQFQDNRIRCIPNEGIGIISALQLGLEHAIGEFITRMDSDDLMPLRRLKMMHDALEDSLEKTIVTGKVKYFTEGELSEGFLNYQNWINERIDKMDHFDHMYRECVVASPNWMVRKKDLLDFTIFDRLIYPEDYDLVFHWFENDFKIKCIQEVTLMWRDHPTRTSKNYEIYNQTSLFRLKVNWFIKMHPISTIGLLGAGTKGKLTAKLLNINNRIFGWYDLNYENFNVPIMDETIQNYESIHEDQLLISIYPRQQLYLLKFLEEKGYSIGRNAWFL